MDVTIPESIKKIMQQFSDAGFQIYIVGGAVRDLLQGKEVLNWDFTTDAKPEEITKLFPDSFYNNKFGTVGIPLKARGDAKEGSRHHARNEVRTDGGILEQQDPEHVQILEVTTMRKEGKYQDFRHPVEVGWTNKLEEDLKRRDFTINALALSSSGELTDIFDGRKDLETGVIRAVGEPTQRFQEDALRLVRAVRIATQLNFEIESKTLQALKENVHLISEVAPERISTELFKILASSDPYSGFILLREVGLLQILLPELEACFGIKQEGPKHDRVYDVGFHSLETLKHTPSKNPIVRLAALLHDIGKVGTMKIQSDGNVTFYQHDVIGGEMVLKIARRFNLSKVQSEKLYKLVRFHLFVVDENQTDSAIRRFIKNIGVENIEDMMALRIGDRLGGGTEKAVSWRMEKFNERIKQVLTKPFSISDLKINGGDIMKELKIKPGPKVGEILNKLFEEVLEDVSKNNRDHLLPRIKELS